jgi:isoleucyl-tRNA synthetase
MHKLDTKDQIEKFGVEKFVNECQKWSVEKAEAMSKDLWRLGVWMDFENACLPINNSYIEGEWFLIKKAHKDGRLYEGLRTMSWCASCQTAMAKHECEYKEVKENSIFVKFPVKGKEKEYLIIWTTTPWTITYNLAIMVNPELDYVKAKVGDEVWILSKALAGAVIQGFTKHTLNVIDEFPGAQLEGLEYEHPWSRKIQQYKEIKAKHPKAHTVLMSTEYVDTSAGTGLVHCAPGCGPEDFEVGYRNNIPAFNNLREDGILPDDMGEFSGLRAKKDDLKFIKILENDGALVASTEVEHDYAHCQRCHQPVIFRATKQWFFKVEDLKERMIAENEKVNWVPEKAKNAFRSWLTNLRDNSITKQRYWGTPVPIWKCESCGKIEVIGSALELKEKAGHCPGNLHKPWIDAVEINCQCGAMMKRIPDILDVWIDAGTLCWNILDYPVRKDLYQKYFPADFIIEGKDQIRGWFNLLMIASILALEKPCFENVYMHGFVTDVEGVKMSKSLGNILSPYEVMDKYGADTLRLYTIETLPGEDLNFSWDEIQLRHRNITILWNMHKYLIEAASLAEIKPADVTKIKDLDAVDRYMISKTHSTIKKVTECNEKYLLHEIPGAVSELFLELSRTYIQMTRDKIAEDESKERVIAVIFHSLMNTLKIMAPLCPFVTEQMFLNMKREFDLPHESIHDYEWPKYDVKLIDSDLEAQFDTLKTVLQGILAAREKVQLGVRWPVKEVIVATKNENTIKTVKDLEQFVKNQTNVKSIKIVDSFDKVKTSVKADYGKLGPVFAEKTAEVVARIATMSPESIMAKLETEGKFTVFTGEKDFEVTAEHLIIKREVPESHVEGECKGGFVYLDKARTPELDAEGMARELMRRIQATRKESGLFKEDRITLFVQTDQKMHEGLKPWHDAIRDKVGATQFNLSFNESARSHQYKKKVKIKETEFVIEFDKVE